MIFDFSELFPLSINNSLRGNRRLVREKALQVILAYYSCEENINDIFKHVFFREFNFGDKSEVEKDKFLRPEEIYELEADIPIQWKEEEIEFGKKLVIELINSRNELDSMIDKYASNWELERIAIIDRILIQIGITEFLNFPEIPPKVTINEALDIAKKYSTDKSKTFINGVLDSVLDDLKLENKLNKTGRGLVDK